MREHKMDYGYREPRWSALDWWSLGLGLAVLLVGTVLERVIY